MMQNRIVDLAAMLAHAGMTRGVCPQRGRPVRRPDRRCGWPRSGKNLGRMALLSAIAIALVLPSSKVQASADQPAPDHRDCAGIYSALSLALPYLPGIFLMFKIAPRSGYAQHMYNLEAKPISKRAVRMEAERRKTEMLSALENGAITLEQLIAQAHACDALYGHDPVPITLEDLLRRE